MLENRMKGTVHRPRRIENRNARTQIANRKLEIAKRRNANRKRAIAKRRNAKHETRDSRFAPPNKGKSVLQGAIGGVNVGNRAPHAVRG